MNTAERTPNRKQLGEMMHGWHSGQGDPIYAVGSFYFADKPYPDPVVVEEALDWFESVTGRDARDTREIKTIVAGLKYYLKHDYPDHRAVVHEEAGRGHHHHWYFVSPQDFRNPSLGYTATLFDRRSKVVGSLTADNADQARAEAKKLWPGAVEKQVSGMREGHTVADFDNIEALIEHARGEGATHVGGKRIYFPDGNGWQEALAFHKDGYWHIPASEYRPRVTQLPGDAQPIEDFQFYQQKGRRKQGEALRRSGAARRDPAWIREAHQGSFERHGFELTRPYPEPSRAGLYHYGPATIWISGPVSGTWWATVKFSNQEVDLNAQSYDEIIDQSKDWVDSLPELQGWGDPRSKAQAIEKYGRRTRGEMGESRSSRRRAPDVERDLKFAGYDFTSGPKGTVIRREHIDTTAPGDYGADPIGDGTFRMVPSGDIVDFAERNRRLSSKGVSEASRRAPAPLATNQLTQYPSGRWGFVGRVDARLLYADMNGDPLSPEALDEIARSSNPAMTLKVLGGKRLSWNTREEAEAALEALTYGGGMEEAPRGKSKGRFPRKHEDDLVKDPDLLPNAIAAHYEKALRERGLKAEATESFTSLPRGWDFANITTVNVDGSEVTFRINVAQGEASGTAVLDPRGQVISTARDSEPEAVFQHLVSDVADHFKTAGMSEKKKKPKGRSRK